MTPFLKRSPANTARASAGWMPSSEPRSSGWNGRSLYAWNISGYRNCMQNWR